MARKSLGASHWKALTAGNEQRTSEEIRSILACPDDDAPMEWRNSDQQFICPYCNRIYKESGGAIAIFPSNDQYQLRPEERTALEEEAARPAEPPSAETEQLWEAALTLAGDLRQKRVLDIGAGRGWASLRFAQIASHTVAFDASENALAAIHENRPPDRDLDLIQGDVCRFPFQEESFDVVFLSNVVNRIRRPERLMREIARVLKPEGFALNIAEPISPGGFAAIGRTDPRAEGGSPSLADYLAMYREGPLRMVPLFPGEIYPCESSLKATIKRFAHHFSHQRSTGERIFIAFHEELFQSAQELRKILERRPANGAINGYRKE